MSMRYYASFLVEDPECEDFRHICGVLELRQPLGTAAGEGDLQAILAKGMNVSRDSIQVVCWSPLH